MNDTGSRELSNSNTEDVEEIGVQSDSPVSVRDILKGEIYVETNKGIVKMPVKAPLGKGSHTLSDDDFECATTELLFKEEQCDATLSDGITFLVESDIEREVETRAHTRKKNDSNKISILYSVPEILSGETQGNLEEFTDSEETLVGFSTLNFPLFDKSMEQIDEIDSLTTTQLSDNVRIAQISKGTSSKKAVVDSKKSIILKNNIKPVISVQKVIKNFSNQKGISFKSKSKCKTNSFGSVLVKSSAPEKVVESYGFSEMSDYSEVNTTPTEDSKPVTKRGGWPKGRKRKPEVKAETRPPKAPATAYVIFLNERRKDFKDIPFTEVTKLLGHEWSRLSLQDKKVYLEQAEVEKKRYREELKFYRQSDAYQTYLHKKRLKRLQGNGTEESDMDATDEIDDEDNEELYCRTCDQWFHSLHNKKEHLYGRQHLQSIAGRYNKMTDSDWRNSNMSSTSFDESSLDGSSYLKGSKEQCCNKSNWSLNMDDAIVKFMITNQEREQERLFLRKKLEEVKAKNTALTLSLQEYNKTLNSLTCMAESERTAQILLEQRLFNLLNVPTLFYLPEPLNEENN
ncbi:UNVERIFIED_CONTAM: hypothetical protein PYX00_007534 [Menopon gallinae]|uniref:HMG box domain-containing protein n=1 Tax=Menopon gallinae TaxID=328185 RepID=A0AAW2HJI3_9NEOP